MLYSSSRIDLQKLCFRAPWHSVRMSGKKYFSMLPLLYLVVTVLLVLQGNFGYGSAQRRAGSGFARANGTHFVRNGKSLYFNGFNAYWMMYMASDPSTRAKVTATFEQASKYGMNVARTWAFRDGGYRPLQSSPGSYNEDVFRVRMLEALYSLVLISLFHSLNRFLNFFLFSPVDLTK